MSVCAWCAVFVLACPSIASEHSAPGSDAEGVQIDISSRPAYSVAYVRLAAGETVVSEAGAMVAMSAGIEVAASLAGGLVQSVARRLVTNESLVMTRYRGVVPGAWVALAPRFPGDLVSVDMVPSSPLYVQAGSLLAHSEHIEVGASVGSIQTVAMREGVTVLAAVGTGPLIIAAYGGLERFDLNNGEQIVVDSGHLAAWSANMRMSIGPLNGVVSSVLTGEGIVAQFIGPGSVFVQTRAEQQMRSWLLPDREHDKRS
jgi:uncharacterized protein (TIGR00266 family)